MSHSKRAHAILSSSGSDRWMNCPPSARLEEGNGEKKSSIYADEGTTAHELSELMLKLEVLKVISDEEYIEKLSDLMDKPSYNEDMLIEVPKYVDYVSDQYAVAMQLTDEAVLLIEEKIDLTEYIPDGFGSSDAVIIANKAVEVIDLKYGKGLRVGATLNSQLMSYGLGILSKYSMMYEIETVILTIHQPRLDNVSSWAISAEDLLAWGSNKLAPAAQLAFAGGGELKSGSWCKFCGVKNRCPKIAEDNMALAKFEFAEPKLLTNDDIAHILSKAPVLMDWAGSILAYATEEAINNRATFTGFKVVEGIARRKWVDEAVAVKALRDNFPAIEDDEIFNTSLKSITDIEKLITKKKFTEVLSDVVIKPQGKPSLVPNSDKRPAMNGLNQAQADFS